MAGPRRTYTGFAFDPRRLCAASTPARYSLEALTERADYTAIAGATVGKAFFLSFSASIGRRGEDHLRRSPQTRRPHDRRRHSEDCRPHRESVAPRAIAVEVEVPGDLGRECGGPFGAEVDLG